MSSTVLQERSMSSNALPSDRCPQKWWRRELSVLLERSVSPCVPRSALHQRGQSPFLAHVQSQRWPDVPPSSLPALCAALVGDRWWLSDARTPRHSSFWSSCVGGLCPGMRKKKKKTCWRSALHTTSTLHKKGEADTLISLQWVGTAVALQQDPCIEL